MSKKDNGLIVALDYLMGEPQEGHNVDTQEPQQGHSVATTGPQRATLKPLHIRLPIDDLGALDAMARQEGTTTAALVRRAIKDLIRRGSK